MRREIANVSFARSIFTAIDIVTVIIRRAPDCRTSVPTISTHKIEPSLERASIIVVCRAIRWIVSQVLLLFIFFVLGEVPRFILSINLEANVVTHACLADVEVKRDTGAADRIVEDVVVPSAAARLLPGVR